MAISSSMHEQGKSSTEIDKIVKIDDGPAFKSFKILNRGIVRMEKQAGSEMQAAQREMMITSLYSYIQHQQQT